MSLDLPIIYLITSGTATSPEQVLRLIQAAVDAEVSLIQIREKLLNARALYELTAHAVSITRGSKTRLLVNDRADIAHAAGADGVHLTTQSLPAGVVRKMFGAEFLIGVSTHSMEEVLAVRAAADFVVFGPVFETDSKRGFGAPQGLGKLRAVTSELREFPVVAIGGVTLENVAACFDAGAKGVAAIRLLSDPVTLRGVVNSARYAEKE